MSSDKTKMEWKYTSYQDLKKIGSGVLNCELIKGTILRCNNKFEIDLSEDDNLLNSVSVINLE